MLRDITARLYSDTPAETLYHYTTFKGLLGIVDSRSLWASEIRYMNDSAEIRHAVDLIRAEIQRRISAGHPNAQLLNQFNDWVAHRMTSGHMLFGASFRANGNLLSQWRGYSAMGKGVSLGFNPDYLVHCAARQSFQVGKCIYSRDAQTGLIAEVVDAIEEYAGSGAVGDNAWQHVFADIESDLLRIAAILKHPSFEEEAEWRVVSPVLTDYVSSPVQFREGSSMLVPYLAFSLENHADEPIALEHIFLGPTLNIAQSMSSLTMYLAKNGIHPAEGIAYCQIPYRQQ